MTKSLHPSHNQWVIYVAHKDFICEVHLAFMQELIKIIVVLNKWLYLGFVE